METADKRTGRPDGVEIAAHYGYDWPDSGQGWSDT